MAAGSRPEVFTSRRADVSIVVSQWMGDYDGIWSFHLKAHVKHLGVFVLRRHGMLPKARKHVHVTKHMQRSCR